MEWIAPYPRPQPFTVRALAVLYYTPEPVRAHDLSPAKYIDEKFVFHNFVRIVCACASLPPSPPPSSLLTADLPTVGCSLFACDMMIMFTLSFYYCYVVVWLRPLVSRYHAFPSTLTIYLFYLRFASLRRRCRR